jgi:hypothetical protein
MTVPALLGGPVVIDRLGEVVRRGKLLLFNVK